MAKLKYLDSFIAAGGNPEDFDRRYQAMLAARQRASQTLPTGRFSRDIAFWKNFLANMRAPFRKSEATDYWLERSGIPRDQIQAAKKQMRKDLAHDFALGRPFKDSYAKDYWTRLGWRVPEYQRQPGGSMAGVVAGAPVAAAAATPAVAPVAPAAPVVPKAPANPNSGWDWRGGAPNPNTGYLPYGGLPADAGRWTYGLNNMPKGTAYIPGVGWKSPAQGGGVAGTIFTDQALAQGAMRNSVLEGYRQGEIGSNRIAQLLAARQARGDMGTTAQDAERWMARQEAFRQQGLDRQSAENIAGVQAAAVGAKAERENEGGLPKAQKEWKSFTRTDEYKSMKPEQVAGLKKALTWWRKEGQALEKQSESDLTSIPELLSGDQEKADMYEYLASHGWIG